MLTEERLYRDFEHYKRCAEVALCKNDVETAMEAMKLACILAKNFYLCYADNQMEEMCKECSSAIFRKINRQEAVGERGKFIFYDTHAMDNVALTQQYLSALISWDVDFLYLTTRKLDGDKTKIIREALETCENATVSVVPENLSMIDTAAYIRSQIEQYGAGRAFIQTVSDDVAGIAAWESIDGIETYYIDLSDHSFWLGTRAFDYYITFRSYGYNICIQHRGVKAYQVLVQPFYPIMTSKEYKGVPETNSNSVKILSGGRLDKIYGRNDMYFNLMKGILSQNPTVEIFFCGGGAFGKLGQTSYIRKQIREKQIDDRFHLLGFRDDIVELMRHVDIYVGTYPIGGGLMTQIASSEGLPIVQYATDGLSSSIQEFLDLKPGERFTFIDDLEGFFGRVRELVKNLEYREEVGEIYKEAVFTPDRFSRQLKELLEHPDAYQVITEYPVDCTKLRVNQIDVENNCFHSYPRILIKSNYVRKKQPFVYFWNAIQFVRYSDKMWLLHQLTGRK